MLLGVNIPVECDTLHLAFPFHLLLLVAKGTASTSAWSKLGLGEPGESGVAFLRHIALLAGAVDDRATHVTVRLSLYWMKSLLLD